VTIFVLGLIGGGLLGLAAAHIYFLPVELISSTDRDSPPRTAPSLLGRYPVEVLRVIDGDTFEARVHVWPGFDLTTRVRLRGIDAPELKARCEDERVRAEAAREALRNILNERDVSIWSVGPDKYFGRIVAEVSTRRTAEVSAAMLSKGVARSYSGSHRDGWCDLKLSGG
jgi:endonuclease YncB( thermonuclease family)